MRQFHMEKSIGFDIQDPFLTKIINLLMSKGKKSKAVKLVVNTFEELAKNPPQIKINSKSKKPLNYLKNAVLTVKPVFELKKVRRAGTNYEVPAILCKKRQESIAIQWILEGAKLKKKRNTKQPFYLILAQEIRDSFQRESYACKKRDNLNRQVEANRAMAHFRWW